MSRESGTRGGPPELRLGLLRKLKILAVANALPLLVVAFVCYQIWVGKMRIRDDVPLGEVGFWVALLLVCCLVVGVSSWFVMPTVRWLRDYPSWYYRNGSSTLWLLPTIAGWGIWLGTWILMTLCAIGMVALIAIGLWSLGNVVADVHDQEPETRPLVDPPGPYDQRR